jgi:hypothetical protein
MSRPILLFTTLAVTGLIACVHVDDVHVDTMQPRYLRPTPAMRSPIPLAIVYDPNEIPDVLTLTVPNGFPPSKLLGARSLVTQHLRNALESLFEHVSVATGAAPNPQGGLVCTVRFVDAGLAVAPGGKTLVGTLEWSVTITRPGEPRSLYSWGERTVGSREGAGSFGSIDPAPMVQGAVEASLRAMLKDMDAKQLADRVASEPPAADPAPPPPAPPR